ncbi:MAG: LysR family transcriptional regulator [Armatimonadetes bacterium]|nr:LysR family transcriptional regulator [Armatimonadota bacterium]
MIPLRDGLNFQHVRAFCAIVAEGSFSRAARQLQITQPTISAQIQLLEKALDARLLERSAQGVQLTAAGQTFHPYALDLLATVARAEEAMNELAGVARGRLELGASSVPGHYLLPRALVLFKQRHPGVDLRLVVSNSQEIRTQVREGVLELGLVGERVRDERLTFTLAVEDELVVVMRPDHPLAGSGELAPDVLRECPLLLREYGSATRATLERALEAGQQNTDDLNILLELGSTEAIKSAIRTVDAVAILSRWTVQEEVRLGVLRAVPMVGLDLRRELYLVARAHGMLSSAGRAFLRFLREEYLPESAAASRRVPPAAEEAPCAPR